MTVSNRQPDQPKMFDTVLIANRGEIALRVVRTCKEMGIRSVVVYSTSDRDSLAVLAADEAVHIGPGPAKQSYLYPPAIIEAAVRTGAQAIHPGYGFLSEDSDFAEICASNGIVFVGPRPTVMSQLGDKTIARKLVAKAGLPVLAGTSSPVLSVGELVTEANRVGLPLIIKAAAGGGGRGMSVVREWADLLPTYRTTRATAQAVFGDGRVYLERYFEQSRHIEVQVLADELGNVLYLGERDCSVQRRHQKLLEESPAANLAPGVSERLGELAVRAAREVGYTGAGTFEFLVRDEEIAFIEVNSRIQVEHPVTEAVVGIDLVREQLRAAAGMPLSVSQSEVATTGAAIECRVNAENPAKDFAPCPGRLDEFVPPGGPFVRVDTHAYAGWKVPAEYDSLLAKVIAWGSDRNQALDRMDRALAEFRIAGPGMHTTIPLLREVIADKTFRAAEHTTSFLDTRHDEE